MQTKKKVVAKKKAAVVGTPKLTWSHYKLDSWWRANARLDADGSAFDHDELDDDGSSFAESTNFAGCCALGIIFDLTAPHLPRGWTKAMYYAAICLWLRSMDLAPWTLATTVPSQTAEIRILRAIGFKPIKQIVNPNTQNEVTLWLSATPR